MLCSVYVYAYYQCGFLIITSIGIIINFCYDIIKSTLSVLAYLFLLINVQHLKTL